MRKSLSIYHVCIWPTFIQLPFWDCNELVCMWLNMLKLRPAGVRGAGGCAPPLQPLYPLVNANKKCENKSFETQNEGIMYVKSINITNVHASTVLQTTDCASFFLATYLLLKVLVLKGTGGRIPPEDPNPTVWLMQINIQTKSAYCFSKIFLSGSELVRFSRPCHILITINTCCVIVRRSRSSFTLKTDRLNVLYIHSTIDYVTSHASVHVFMGPFLRHKKEMLECV